MVSQSWVFAGTAFAAFVKQQRECMALRLPKLGGVFPAKTGA